jgi:aminoglycoside phosphotransferase (APT) family kinase protein
MPGANRPSAHVLTGPNGEALVLRWFDGWPASLDEVERPVTLVRREALALAALAGSGVPVPRLIAWKADDVPVLLAQRLPGEVRMAPPDVGALQTVLDRLHATPAGDLAAWSYRGYHEGVSLVRPSWWVGASVWERARVATETRRPTSPPVLIHRDFHAGNLLWSDRELTGVIDWGQACVGPAEFDTAHWRVNHALLHGGDAIPPEMAGDPSWDIEAAFGIFDGWDQDEIDRWRGPWNHIDGSTARQRLEAFVVRAVAALG